MGDEPDEDGRMTELNAKSMKQIMIELLHDITRKIKKATTPRQLPFVWKLTYNGTTSHAIGTNHTVPDAYSDDALLYVIAKENVLIETDNRKIPQEKIDALCSKTLTNTIEQLTLPERRILSDITGMSIPQLREYPIAGFHSHLVSRYYGSVPLKSIDTTIVEHAEKIGVPVRDLETVDELLEWREPEKHVLGDIKELIEAERKGSWKTTLKFIKAYEQGDLEALTRQANNYSIKSPERNQRMVERSLPCLERPTLIAVGVGHFVKEPTMLAMYKEKGVKIERIR